MVELRDPAQTAISEKHCHCIIQCSQEDVTCTYMYIRIIMEEFGPEDVSLLERCPLFRGCYVQARVELGPEDVPLLERCPHFRGCYVQVSLELVSEALESI